MLKWLRRRAPAIQIPDPDTGFFGGELDFEHQVEAPTYEQLAAEHEMLLDVIDTHADTYRAAQQLIETLCMVSEPGVPIFVLNSEELDANSVELLRHAVLNLQATITGTEPPQLALEGRSIQ